ncbi:phosphatase PAP2 family protein [Variovorax guangxiensis]|uniref:phosphatase PAP2 family protein n=1 Tax=Variovorax guangxiensis TaxID=1775474 RepID=UPI0028605621|nr:phosphatase PAP2 family protein [Variovorax guangxiensis]MDR6860490.1 undecaprenyl-diphosphatase [Variovorax guangxiensis]
MKAFDLLLFHWMAAGFEPRPWLVAVAGAIAVGGPWLCAALLGWIAWRQPSQRGYLMAVLGVAALAALLAHSIAAALNLPRPFMLGLSPPYIAHGARGSLPSAHATVMFTVALLCLARPVLRGAGAAIFAIAMLTGWGRIHVGVHFPGDILAGLLLALALAGLFVGLRHLVRRHVAPMIARDGPGRRAMAGPPGQPGP